MKIPTEESYFVFKTTVRLWKGIPFKDGLERFPCGGWAEDKPDEEFDIEERYTIHRWDGDVFLPHRVYESFVSDECWQAQHLIKPHRKFKYEPLYTWMPYYDDAEIVLENIKRYILWLKTAIPKMNAKQKRKISLNCERHLHDVEPREIWEQRKAFMNGVSVKRREDLKGIARHLMDEKHFVEQVP